MDILDQILAADMAKQYSDSKGGYTKPGKVFTYDGEDAEFFDIAGLRVALLSADVFDLSKIKRIKCIVELYGQELEFAEGDFELIDFNGYKAVQVSLGNKSAPVVIAPESGGLFGYAQTGFGYCSYVEFAETIVPIDPKYLPGLCLPVVELTTEISETSKKLTAEESASLEAAADAGLPCVFRIKSIGTCGVSMLINDFDGEGHPAFIPLTEASIIVVKTADGWYATLGG